MSYFYMIPRSLTFYISLICGMLIFLLQQKRRRWFGFRLLLSMAVGVFSMNHLYFEAIHTFGGVDNFWNTIIFVSALLLAWPISKFCFDISWSEAFFCAVAGYSAQFIHSITYEMVYRLFVLDALLQYIVQFAIGVIVFGTLYVYFGRTLRKGQNFNVGRWPLMTLLVLVVVVEIVLCYNLRQPWIYNLDKVQMICEGILLAICSSAVLSVQISLLVQQELIHELQIIKQMWRRDQEQYRISSETIDLINRKCHDIRFQIRSIGHDANVVPSALEDMEQTIEIYDAMYQTDCRALDIILTEKSLLCQANGITLSCVADASKLCYISDPDIYSLFGNILDNAINAVNQLDDDDSRIVSLTIRQYGEMLSINSHNFYKGKIVMQNGLPQTSDGNHNDHGFGVKSIAAIVRKYGGSVSFQANMNVFNLNILFPLDAFMTEHGSDNDQILNAYTRLKQQPPSPAEGK